MVTGRLDSTAENVFTGESSYRVKNEVKSEAVDCSWQQITSQTGGLENLLNFNLCPNEELTEDKLECFGLEHHKQGNVGDKMFERQEGPFMSPEYSNTELDYSYPCSDSQSSCGISESSPDSPNQTYMNIPSHGQLETLGKFRKVEI